MKLPLSSFLLISLLLFKQHGAMIGVLREHAHCLTSRVWYSTSSYPFSRDAREVGEAPPLVSREWIEGATKYLLELVKEKIETYGSSLFQQKHWMRIGEQLMKTIIVRRGGLGCKSEINGTS
jgi:hypothetical protein